MTKVKVVQVVDDVRPYEHMKLRLPNSGHFRGWPTSDSWPLTYAHEAMENPDIRRLPAQVHG